MRRRSCIVEEEFTGGKVARIRAKSAAAHAQSVPRPPAFVRPRNRVGERGPHNRTALHRPALAAMGSFFDPVAVAPEPAACRGIRSRHRELSRTKARSCRTHPVRPDGGRCPDDLDAPPSGHRQLSAAHLRVPADPARPDPGGPVVPHRRPGGASTSGASPSAGCLKQRLDPCPLASADDTQTSDRMTREKRTG